MKLVKKMKGFTLIELLLVVGLIAVAGVAAYIAYPKVQAQSRANTEAQNINTVAAGVKNLYTSQSSYGTANTDLTTSLVNAKVIPQSMVGGTVASPTVNNALGGTVMIAVSDYNGGSGNAFTIGYSNVPAAECIKLATGVGENFNRVNISAAAALTAAGTGTPGGTTVKDTAAATPINSVQVATATAQCNPAAGKANIYFTML